MRSLKQIKVHSYVFSSKEIGNDQCHKICPLVVSSIKYDMLQNCHYFLYIYNGLCTIQVNVIVRSPAQVIITISSITAVVFV